MNSYTSSSLSFYKVIKKFKTKLIPIWHWSPRKFLESWWPSVYVKIPEVHANTSKGVLEQQDQ